MASEGDVTTADPFAIDASLTQPPWPAVPSALKAGSCTLNQGPGPAVTGTAVCMLSEPSALVRETWAFPAAAFSAEKVKEPLPPAYTVAEAGETATPSGTVSTVTVTASVNPFCPLTVTLMLSFSPGATVICAGDKLNVKLAGPVAGGVADEPLPSDDEVEPVVVEFVGVVPPGVEVWVVEDEPDDEEEPFDGEELLGAAVFEFAFDRTPPPQELSCATDTKSVAIANHLPVGNRTLTSASGCEDVRRTVC